MKSICFPLLALSLFLSCGPSQKKEVTETSDQKEILTANQINEDAFFEMRTYYCYPGMLEALKARFRDHTMKLFEKHGMTNVGYWEPQDNSENKLIYLMAYPGRAARDSSWAAFSNDPEWKSVYQASHVNGPIVDSVVNAFYHYSTFSPKLLKEDLGPRIFSLRTYYTNPGKLEALRNRFANHTLEIFENNGIHNLVYLDLDSTQVGADHILTYLVTFPDTTARTKSWNTFRADPKWQAAYNESIQNGKLVDSITDVLLLATDFSPIK
jgi:hypothetical protein